MKRFLYLFFTSIIAMASLPLAAFAQRDLPGEAGVNPQQIHENYAANALAAKTRGDIFTKDKSPSLPWGYQRAEEVKINFTTAEDITLYVLAVKTAELEENLPKAEHKSKAISVAAEKEKETSATIKGLTRNTDYKVFVYDQDPTKAEAKVVATIDYKTAKLDPLSFTSDVANLGSQTLEGFTEDKDTEIKLEPYPAVKSWKLSADAGLINVNGSLEGEKKIDVLGFTIATDVEVEIFLDGQSMGKVESTEMKPYYVSLKGKGEISVVKIVPAEKNKNVHLVDFGKKVLDVKLKDFPELVFLPTSGNLEIDPTYLIGGVTPLTYTWKNGSTDLGNELQLSTDKVTETAVLKLEVKDADETIYPFVVQVVKPDPTWGVATFEDLDIPLADESYWNASTECGLTFHRSGAYYFINNTTNPVYKSFNGFTFSNETSSDFDMLHYSAQAGRCIAGGGAKGTKTFATYYGYNNSGPSSKIRVCSSAEGATVKGTYLTNTANVYDAIVKWDKGRGYSGNKIPIKTGDYVTVTFTGNNGKKIDAYLLDYRSDDVNEHYFLKDWAWIDLTSLDKVEWIRVSLKAFINGKDDWWFPAYFSIDEFGSDIETLKSKTKFMIVGADEQTHDLQAVFMEDGLKKTGKIEYTIIRSPKEGLTGATFTIKDQKLSTSGWNGSTVGDDNVVVRATQLGHTYQRLIPVHFEAAKPFEIKAINVDVPANGTVKVLNAKNEELGVNGKVKTNDIIKIVFAPIDNVRATEINVTNAYKNADGTYTVTGDVEISITTKQLTPKTLKTVKFEPQIAGLLSIFNDFDTETPLAESSKIYVDDKLVVTALINEPFKLEEAKFTVNGVENPNEPLKIDLAERTVSATYVVNEDVTVTVEVTAPVFKLVALNVTPKPNTASIVVKNSQNKKVNLGGDLVYGEIITIEVTPERGYEIVGKIQVTNADPLSGRQYLVKGDVTVTVATQEEETPTPVESSLFAATKVFPNPCDGILQISSDVPSFSYAIYSVAGILVDSGLSTNGISQVNTTALQQGVYLIQLRADDGTTKVLRFQKR